ncbi:hypothetical protein [Paraburkholderia sp. Cpub6]|uniref:hypothetical protein n=1 Tax=Paraburkholderia sp. Cpub6 TaxID=2723094 RepID=UPI001608EEA4|nr:hypothetical protein [Paraburkholderia sp. Cpub6]MBB5462911.1 hypothetical protein [Paraburkholderia sp. Cpub6]
MSASIGEIDFSANRGQVSGFARGWFFWVHQSSKPALDITYSEIIEPNKTQVLRDGEARRRGFDSLADMQSKIKAAGGVLGKSKDNKAVMARSVKMAVVKQGDPPAYSFRVTDTFESRCGNWSIQVGEAKPDSRTGKKKTVITAGRVGFDLFKHIDDDSSERWSRRGWFVVSQKEFVTLLRTGNGLTLNLCAPDEVSAEVPDAEPTVDGDNMQGDLFGA